jgi:hypothetical protein
VWLGRLPIPKLFDAEHGFAVRPAESGTEFVHTERFRGILPPLLGGVLAATHEAFTRMDAALLARAESLHPDVTERTWKSTQHGPGLRPPPEPRPNRGVCSRAMPNDGSSARMG